mmetsp:Transcript_22859/g.40474  ORF Transcript_22859/g.40474 Transcript_22859/m.40474 type:complete len:116 (-) Transcript_22859:105-452(-)
MVYQARKLFQACDSIERLTRNNEKQHLDTWHKQEKKVRELWAKCQKANSKLREEILFLKKENETYREMEGHFKALYEENKALKENLENLQKATSGGAEAESANNSSSPVDPRQRP